jgi:hypothetical protein
MYAMIIDSRNFWRTFSCRPSSLTLFYFVLSFRARLAIGKKYTELAYFSANSGNSGEQTRVASCPAMRHGPSVLLCWTSVGDLWAKEISAPILGLFALFLKSVGPLSGTIQFFCRVLLSLSAVRNSGQSSDADRTSRSTSLTALSLVKTAGQKLQLWSA